MTIRLPLALVGAATLLAACQPPPSPTVTVDPNAVGGATVTTTTDVGSVTVTPEEDTTISVAPDGATAVSATSM